MPERDSNVRTDLSPEPSPGGRITEEMVEAAWDALSEGWQDGSGMRRALEAARLVDPLVEENAKLRQIGDRLQSEANRIAAYLSKQDAPYEVFMAKLEVETAVAEWAEVRAALSPPDAGEDG